MQTARRLYLYLMSGISLGVMLVGLTMLLTVVFNAIGVGRGVFAGGDQSNREQLSLAAALIVVGLLVWSVHWLFVERSLRANNPSHDEERASGVRALYLTVVLAVLLIFGVLAGIQLLQVLVRTVMGVSDGGGFGFAGIALSGSLATLLVTAVAWAYHARVRRRDLDAGPLAGAAAWIPRVYLYGAGLVGLIMTGVNVGGLLSNVLGVLLGDAPDFGGEDFRQRQAADAIAGVIGWGIVWLGHWWYATSLMRDTRWRGVSERHARLRLAYFVGAIMASAIGIIAFGSQALSAVLAMALGVADEFGSTPDAAIAIGLPIASMLPWPVAWWLHVRWMRAESMEADGPDWIATVDRLEAGAVALVGALAGAIGTAATMGLLIDVALGGNRTEGTFWRVELSGFMSLAAIGVVIWLWNWSRLERRRAAAPVVEAGSTVRRSYLLIVVAAALISSLGSLAFVLYRLFNAVLQVDQFGNQASALSSPLGALVVAGSMALYHGLAVRRDQRVRAQATAELADQAPSPAATPVADAEVTRAEGGAGPTCAGPDRPGYSRP